MFYLQIYFVICLKNIAKIICHNFISWHENMTNCIWLKLSFLQWERSVTVWWFATNALYFSFLGVCAVICDQCTLPFVSWCMCIIYPFRKWGLILQGFIHISCRFLNITNILFVFTVLLALWILWYSIGPLVSWSGPNLLSVHMRDCWKNYLSLYSK